MPTLTASGRRQYVAVLAGLVLGGTASSALAGVKTIDRVSVSSAGAQGNGASGGVEPPAISADGRFLAFVSSASNLVPGDTNGVDDIFVRDRTTGSTERVSVASDGAQSNGASGNQFFHAGPSISDDGRFVAFTSYASNLVAGDTNNQGDVFVRDRTTGTTELISQSSAGVRGNDRSWIAVISATGRYVVLQSSASNLVEGDTNGVSDIFVRDRQTGTTERVSIAAGGAQGDAPSQGNPSISADGRFVAFESFAANLVAGDTNSSVDVFVRDRVAGTTERVSVATGGVQGNGSSFSSSMTPDGRFVAFDTAATNLGPGDTNGQADVYVRDRRTSTTDRVSVSAAGGQGNNNSGRPWMSADGRFVFFPSLATNLVVPDANGDAEDVLVKDRATGTLERFHAAADGAQGNLGSLGVAVSADGYHFAFVTAASNLVTDDTNNAVDLFVAERAEAARPYRIAVYRPETRDWHLRSPQGTATVVHWGGPGDQPAAANYLGDDPDTEIAIFRPSNREWHLRIPRLGKGQNFIVIPFGGPEDQPVFADYLGIGRAQLAVFRPSTREWFIRSDAGTTVGPIQFGGPDDVPVPANYLGDGRRAQIAVFRTTTREWFIRTDTGGTVGPVPFGGPGDVPVPADYLGIGRSQIAVFRPASAEWFLRGDSGATTPIQFGDPGDIPLPGDYFGLGHAQVAVFRPSTGEWFVRGATGWTARYDWGGPGDVPVPGNYAPGFGG